MYKIEWANKAFKQLCKIRERKVRQFIFSEITKLENFPDCENVLKLKSRKGYRLRVQNWRVIFDKDDAHKIINIQEVRKRSERTYR